MLSLRQSIKTKTLRGPLVASFTSRATTIKSCDELENKFLVKTYNPNGVRTKENLMFTHGKGSYLFDQNKDKYLDFSSGIAVTGLGHGDPEWIEAVSTQAKALAHTSNLFHCRPQVELAQLLIENTKFDKAFFCNSGTEANEAAYKFARLYANQKNPDKTGIIAFKGGFHGRTAASLSMTYKPAIREPFLPLLPNIHFSSFNDIHAVEKLLEENKTIAGIIVEPIQGEGGVVPAKLDFLMGLRELCTKHHIVLICDEVQSGLGRAGHMFAHEAYGILPDIVTLAKPLAGGLPIGAVLTTDKIAQSITPGTHGTTFGGNPIACSGALVVVNRLLSDGFLESVQQKGKQLHMGLVQLMQKFPTIISEIRTPLGECGLFAGIECSIPVAPLIKKAANEGIIIISAGENVIRLAPPLTVTELEISEALAALDKILMKQNIGYSERV